MMRLGLSSAAAPDATIEELLAVCARRGLGALELRAEDGHGLDRRADETAGEDAARRAGAAGVTIAAYRAGARGSDLRLARLAHVLGATVLLEAGRSGASARARLDRAEGLVSVGARIALVVRGEKLIEDATLAAARGLDLAWDVDPAVRPVGADAERLLSAFGDRLVHIRINGGGPETGLHEGRGVGELMGRLALAGFAGAVVLAPSSARYRVAWESWLGRRGGWGCGSTVEDPTLVRLAVGEGAGVVR